MILVYGLVHRLACGAGTSSSHMAARPSVVSSVLKPLEVNGSSLPTWCGAGFIPQPLPSGSTGPEAHRGVNGRRRYFTAKTVVITPTSSCTYYLLLSAVFVFPLRPSVVPQPSHVHTLALVLSSSQHSCASQQSSKRPAGRQHEHGRAKVPGASWGAEGVNLSPNRHKEPLCLKFTAKQVNDLVYVPNPEGREAGWKECDCTVSSILHSLSESRM